MNNTCMSLSYDQLKYFFLACTVQVLRWPVEII